MAITALPYGVFLTDLGSGVHTFGTDTDKVALLTSSYSPNYTTDTSYANVSANEVTGGGYTAGGVALTSVTWTGTGNTATLGAAAASWTGLAVTCRYAAVYKSTGTASTSKLIGLLDFGQDRVYDSEPFQLSFPSGVVTISAS